MTPNEFKKRYNQYAHLEGDTLWDTMTEVLSKVGITYYADPNRVKEYDELLLPNGRSLHYEVNTEWFDEEGNRVDIDFFTPSHKENTEVYKVAIWDAKNLKEIN